MDVRLFEVTDQGLTLHLINFSSISLVPRMRITQFEDLIMRFYGSHWVVSIYTDASVRNRKASMLS